MIQVDKIQLVRKSAQHLLGNLDEIEFRAKIRCIRFTVSRADRWWLRSQEIEFHPEVFGNH